MKKLYLPLLFCLLCYGCRLNITTNKSDISGAFFKKGSFCEKLVFNESEFYYVNTCMSNDYIAQYICCDTLARGKYLIDKNQDLVNISSDFEITQNILNFHVKEEIDPSIKDSVVIIFNSPIIDKKRFHKNLIFEVSLITKYNASYIKSDKSILSSKSVKDFDGTNDDLIGVIVIIYPKSDMLLSNFGIYKIPVFIEEMYPIKNPKANKFEISIPNLTYEFIALKRLNNDYVKIENENKLIWDGKEYIKKSPI